MGCNKAPQDGVAATVNGHAIQRAEVDKDYNAQLAQNPQQQAPSADPPDVGAGSDGLRNLGLGHDQRRLGLFPNGHNGLLEVGDAFYNNK